MKPTFSTMLETVPPNIRLNTHEYITEKIAVFEPKEYIVGQKVNFDHYHFVVFNSTPPQVKIGNKEHQFQKGSLISFEPGMDLSIIPFEGNNKGEYTSVSINKDFFQTIALEILGVNQVVIKSLENKHSPQLLNIISNFKYELLNHYDGSFKMLEIIGAQMAVQLLRDMDTKTPNFLQSIGKDVKYIKKAIEYMEDNFNGNITIGEVSRHIYVSLAHFERMFKNHTGQTPSQYLIELRIRKSKEMLKRDQYSIQEIGRLCGFANAGHFSTTFKRQEGISPSEYRKIIY